jgi:hypothetical protein
MASFFEKVMWTECTADLNPKCPKAVNREHLPAYKTKCTECGSKVREVSKLDLVKVGLVAVAGLLLFGGGGWYVRYRVINGLGGLFGGGGGSTQPAPNTSGIMWGVETNRGGSIARLSPAQDFQASGNSFRYRDSLTEGDKMRLEVSYKTDKLYAFYRNASEAMRLPTDGGGGRASLPNSNDWFQMDQKTGTEEFILVAASSPVPELDQMTGSFDPVVLDREIRNLESGGKTPVVRIQIPHK